MKSPLTNCVLLATVLLGLCAPLHAKDTILPTTPPESLNKHIRLAADGETILLGRGTYDLDMSILDKSLTIVGVSQKDTIIRNINRSHSIRGKANDKMTVTFEHVTFTQKPRAKASGVHIVNADTVFRHCTFFELHSSSPSISSFATGAAIRMTNSTTLVEHCWFESNYLRISSADSMYASGGAIEAYESDLTILDSDFLDNKVLCLLSADRTSSGEAHVRASGGAVSSFGSKLTVEGTTFEANGIECYVSRHDDTIVELEADGGAIYIERTSETLRLKPRITNCLFRGNDVYVTTNTMNYGSDRWSTTGGALCINVDDIPIFTLVDTCTFQDNQLHGAWNGGAIWGLPDNDSQLHIRNCEFICNSQQQVMQGGMVEVNNYYEDCNGQQEPAEGPEPEEEPEEEPQPEEEPEIEEGPCLYDINGDGVVDQRDYDQALIAQYRNRHDGPEDVNGDGRVDRVDLNLILDNFGECP